MTNEANKILRLIDKLRKVTKAVQITPFIYTALYLAVMIIYPFATDATLHVLDTLFYTSPTITAVFLFLSKILELCKWHRMACLLPIVPQIGVFIDLYVCPLPYGVSLYYILVCGGMAFALLFAAYKTFLE